MGIKRDPFENFRRINRMTPVEMMPKEDYLMELNAGDSILNLKTGENMPMLTVQGIVLPKDGSNRMLMMQGIGHLNRSC